MGIKLIAVHHLQKPLLFGFLVMLLVFIAYAVMAVVTDLSRFIPETIGMCGWITLLLAILIVLGEKHKTDLPPMVILSAALLFRILFLFSEPQLSDDIRRYVFDGRMVLMGYNPYAAAPAATSARHPEMSGLAARVNHPELVTIYPPAAQLVFAAGTALGGVFGIKALLILMDLASCMIIIRLLGLFQQPAMRSILYAWHPLAVLEVAHSGHIDAAAIFFFFAAFFWLSMDTCKASPIFRPNPHPDHVASGGESLVRQGAAFMAGMAFIAAVLTKLYPGILLPGLLVLKKNGNSRSFWIGILIASLLLVWLFWPEAKNSLITLHIYFRDWEFAGFLFRFIRKAIANGEQARSMLLLLFTAATVCIYVHRLGSGRIIGAPMAVSVMSAYYAISLSYLLLTPTLHPWYALYLTALLPFTVGTAGLCLSWSVLIAYQVLIPYKLAGRWVENDMTAFLIFIAPVAAVLLSYGSRAAIYFHQRYKTIYVENSEILKQ